MPMPPLPALPGPPKSRAAARVPPPQMPPLPALPPKVPLGGMPRLPEKPGTWQSARNPSTHLVQKQYVDTRLKELKASAGHSIAGALFVIEQMLLEKIPEPKRPRFIPTNELQRVYKAIEQNLQSADLTINFGAASWFAKPNTYDTYTQMYERAMQSNQMVLMDTAQNQADTRAGVDNNVTFPKAWQNAAAPVRGLRPGLVHPSHIQKQMDTGALNDVRRKPKDLAAWMASNQHFNPHTKQVFWGLNYGRRPHGSATNYGSSYFVGKADLKARCLYYSKDTFHTGTTPNPANVAVPLINQNVDASTLQIPFSNLGAIIGQEGSHIRKAIFESCYEGQVLKDITVKSLNADYLLEAHHFGEVTFRQHVEYMVISQEGLTDDEKDLWPTIVANATTFTKRNGIPLFRGKSRL